MILQVGDRVRSVNELISLLSGEGVGESHAIGTVCRHWRSDDLIIHWDSGGWSDPNDVEVEIITPTDAPGEEMGG